MTNHTARAGFELSELGFKADERTLLEGIDLNLGDKGTTMILGPNGAGKSLLLKLLHGLIQPTTGQIRWQGQPLNDKVRRGQAMVFQKPVLLRRTVAANMDFALKVHRRADPQRRDALLEDAGLLGLADRPARKLSGGEQQRLALARALALEPKTLLLDEPTASLDPASVLLIEQIIRNARAAGTRIIFVTHDVGQARRLADDIVFLHRGRLMEHSQAGTFFEAPQSEAARAYLDGRIFI
jgi:tungstate transport system ATP-binding protein